MKTRKLVVANWKMNLPPLREWTNVTVPKKTEAIVCPPFPYLAEVGRKLGHGLRLGAQDVFWKEDGAYTGEVSPLMLKKAGVRYVIVGHSERRKWLLESDDIVNRKVLAAARAGLKPILCVGEEILVRKEGLAAVKKLVAGQLKRGLRGFSGTGIVVAYEPVWAIGTGRFCNPRDALYVIEFIKKTIYSNLRHLKSRVIYGGSVNGKISGDYLKYSEIDGVLVGGASLRAKEFAKILKSN